MECWRFWKGVEECDVDEVRHTTKTLNQDTSPCCGISCVWIMASNQCTAVFSKTSTSVFSAQLSQTDSVEWGDDCKWVRKDKSIYCIQVAAYCRVPYRTFICLEIRRKIAAVFILGTQNLKREWKLRRSECETKAPSIRKRHRFSLNMISSTCKYEERRPTRCNN
jgi:hypothetical protein